MGNFFMCMGFIVIVYKELVNGFTMIIICIDESI